MIFHCHRLVGSLLLSPLAVAVIGTASVQAMTLGHSRVVSMPQQPLQIAIQLKELTPVEQESLRVSIAPAAAWTEAGLVPPVALSTLQIRPQSAIQAGQRRLLLESSDRSNNEVVDVLIDVSTSSSTQRFQVSVLQQPSPTPISLVQANSTTESQVPTLTPTADSAVQVNTRQQVAQTTNKIIKKGMTAWALAQQHKNPAYTPQQFMMALLQQNPHAFSHNNVNLLRASTHVQIPTAEQVLAIDNQLAQQLYKQHAQWFDTYRQRLAQGETTPTPLSSDFSANVKTLEAASTTPNNVQEFNEAGDRLQLSTETPAEIKAAQTASIAQELAHTSERLAQLNSDETKPSKVTTGLEDSVLKVGDAATPSLETTVTNQLAAVDASSSLSAQASDTETTPELEQKSQTLEKWIQNNLIKVITLLFLAVLFIAWVLRRINHSGLRYAEEISSTEAEQIEKQKKAQRVKSASDEVEFREIK